MSLPKGYKKLEYIQSSGTQFVDTGFKPNQDSGVTIDFQLNAVSGWQCVFGARNTAHNVGSYSLRHSGSAFGFYYSSANATFSNLAGTVRHTVVATKNTAVADGANSVSPTYSNFTANYPLFLFAANSAGQTQNNASMKLYSCQIYDNDTLVRDFVPCQNESGTVGLWDAVNGVFYGNAGTGVFTAGSVVPEIVDESEITELEYIQSSGAQYIDTEFNPKYNTRVVVDVSDATTEDYVFGARDTSSTTATNQFGVYINVSSNLRSDYFGTTVSNAINDIAARTIIDKNTNVTTGYGLTLTNTAVSSGEVTHTLWLFALNDVGNIKAPASIKLYSCQIYDNGLLERDYIPTMLVNGEVGLYDRVSHEFYRNAGTGEFIAGPEASKTPNAPSTFQLDSVSDTSIVVSWHTVADALGYKLWLNGSLLADTTETTVIVTVEPFTCMVLSLVAYNENGNSSVVTLTHQYAPDNPILWLVTDRTTQDVVLSNTKGTYNASDLNRVGYAVAYLADKLASCGVATTVHPKTDWLTTDIPSEQVLVTYLQNVRTLRTALTLVASVPEVPHDMQFFTHTEANRIEMLLVMLDTHITNMLSNVDTSWAVGSTYTGLYAKEAYR